MNYSQQTPEAKTLLFLAPVPAGFPSPADDYLHKSLDLNEYLIKHPASTSRVRVKDDSMINAGIFTGDLLIVDRSLKSTDRRSLLLFATEI
jgi:DNA polymerase V